MPLFTDAAPGSLWGAIFRVVEWTVNFDRNFARLQTRKLLGRVGTRAGLAGGPYAGGRGRGPLRRRAPRGRAGALIAAVRLDGRERRFVVQDLPPARNEEGVYPRQNENRDEDENGGHDDLEG